MKSVGEQRLCGYSLIGACLGKLSVLQSFTSDLISYHVPFASLLMGADQPLPAAKAEELGASNWMPQP